MLQNFSTSGSIKTIDLVFLSHILRLSEDKRFPFSWLRNGDTAGLIRPLTAFHSPPIFFSEESGSGPFQAAFQVISTGPKIPRKFHLVQNTYIMFPIYFMLRWTVSIYVCVLCVCDTKCSSDIRVTVVCHLTYTKGYDYVQSAS